MSSLETALAGTRFQSYVYAYPHKTAYRRIEPAPLAELWAAERRDALFLYFHIPFCEQRCGFCNLFTRPVPPEDTVAAYMQTLARQVRVVRRALDAGGAFDFALGAIGGGTPTLLDARQLEQLFGLVRAMGARPGMAMSVETSPETALPDRLAVVVGGGADRISIGVQSFIDSECKAVNRPQRAADVHRALRAIRDAKVATLNIDVMYGLPGQTEATWRTTLGSALEYKPEEIYLYPLYVRPLTTLGKKHTPTVDNHRVALYDQARDTLRQAGYVQRSLRMFVRRDLAKPTAPRYCCQTDAMVGLGCGARSYTRGVHYSTEWAVGAHGVRDIIDRWIARDDASFAVADYGFVLDTDEQRRRYVILSLLSAEGLEFAAYRERFGAYPLVHFPQLRELLDARLAIKVESGHWVMSDKGFAHADVIGPWLYSDAVRTRMAEYALS
jgi:oxygen-independent coproporphyrinogen-3 oxidase